MLVTGCQLKVHASKFPTVVPAGDSGGRSTDLFEHNKSQIPATKERA